MNEVREQLIIKCGSNAQQSGPSLLVMRDPDGDNWFVALFHGDGKWHELTFPAETAETVN